MGHRSQRQGLSGRRFREPKRRSRHLAPALLLAAGLLLAAPASAHTFLRWTLDLYGGQDDQVLSGRSVGVLRPVAEEYVTGSTRFLMRVADDSARNRLDLIGRVTGTAYGSAVGARDADLKLVAAFRRRMSDRLAVDLSGTTQRFRREGDPVFDTDFARGEATVAWATGRAWLLTGSVQHEWVRFPGRATAPELLDRQRVLLGSAGATYRFGAANYLGTEFQYRTARAGLERYDYSGPRVLVRSRIALPARLLASGVVSYGERRYQGYVIAAADPGEAPLYEGRLDRTLQFALTIERPLNERVRLFADALILDQDSDVPVYAYDQTRVSLGVTVDLIQPAPRNARREATLIPAPVEHPLAPLVGAGRVVFHFRGAGADRVHLVGGFNGWDVGSTPLRPHGDGTWSVSVPLAPGVWRYAFVVDGVWVTPAGALRYEADGFGGRHGLVEVPGPGGL